jgi:Family of unknown function (DUF5996)
MTDASETVWPSLPSAGWQATRDTLHLWTQIVGKVRMAHAPLVNHWWNVTLYVTPTGLSTSTIPYGERSFQIDFDFHAHELVITTSDGDRRAIALEPKSVADFYAEVMGTLDELGLTTSIWPMPVEIAGDVVPFDEDRDHASYDPDAVHRFSRVLGQIDRVLHVFRARFVGKVSPVHFFWGGFDLAVTRFSGSRAPLFPRGAPHCGPHVMQEAYSHEVSSAGYWPDGGTEGLLYSYAYPEPDGFRNAPTPDGAVYDEELGEFVLPYELVHTSQDPDALLLDFLQLAYEAAANNAGWDRQDLERA